MLSAASAAKASVGDVGGLFFAMGVLSPFTLRGAAVPTNGFVCGVAKCRPKA